MEASRLVRKQVWCQSHLLSKGVEGRIGKEPIPLWASLLTLGAWTSNALLHQGPAPCISWGSCLEPQGFMEGCLGLVFYLQVGAGILAWIPLWDSCWTSFWFAVEAPPLTCFSEALYCQSCKNLFLLSDEAWDCFLFFVFLKKKKLQGRISSLVEMMSVELLLWWCAIQVCFSDSGLSVLLREVYELSLKELMFSSPFE